jgi:hypothetical protein
MYEQSAQSYRYNSHMWDKQFMKNFETVKHSHY